MADVEPSSTKPVTLIALRHGGTHLIQPLIRELTQKSVHVPKGQNAIDCRPGKKLVIFLRDPRNRLVSQLRYKNRRMEPGELADDRLASLMVREKFGTTTMEYMHVWAAKWAQYQGGHLQMRFEDLMSDPLYAAECMAIYLDVPGGENATKAVEYTIGKSGTFTGRHSKWTEWFGPKATKAWRRTDGPRLLELMGYAE